MKMIHNSQIENLRGDIDNAMVNFDTIILSGGIFFTMLLVNFFGINGENVVLYLLVGLIMTGYKLAKSKRYTRHEIVATILLGFFFSIIIAPTIEMKAQLHPLTTGAILGGLILLGELGIYVTFEKFLGMKLEVDKFEETNTVTFENKKTLTEVRKED